MAFSNHLLCELPLAVRREVARLGRRIKLPAGEILQAQGEPQVRCHFIEAGVVSVSRIQDDGARVEAALVGREGFVGSLVAETPAFTQAQVLIAVRAFCLETRTLQGLFAREPAVQDVLGRYQRFQLDEAQLNAACNSSHGVPERLAKWLLRCLDRVDAPEIALTQESLAEMLGVQRTTVTAVVQRLILDGAIRARRGLIEVIDRDRLSAIACECYEQATERLPELGLPEPSEESACAA
jgi:CRP-like cAMP-binding protein